MSSAMSIDPDLLRTFAFIAEEGSFTRAAERAGRTQSAVSMQVQRLESLLGQKVLRRNKGGAIVLTPHGQYLLGRSRELLALNDEIWSAFRAPAIQGSVRLGTPDDYALRYLPQVLKRFADTHPSVEVEVICAPSSEVVARLKAGELDLTLCSEGHEPVNWPSVELWRGPLTWITSDRHAPHMQDPLPLALATICTWRNAALNALHDARRRHRIAYSSATFSGTYAPVLAGLAVTASPITFMPDGVRAVRPGEGLPPLPDCAILLLEAREPRQPVTGILARHIAETFRAEMPRN
jgi:molybdate transport repressor ModE-like protein